MKTFAVLSLENIVTNVIYASSLDIAESLTNSRCVRVTEETGIASVGFSYNDNIFVNTDQAPTE